MTLTLRQSGPIHEFFFSIQKEARRRALTKPNKFPPQDTDVCFLWINTEGDSRWKPHFSPNCSRGSELNHNIMLERNHLGAGRTVIFTINRRLAAWHVPFGRVELWVCSCRQTLTCRMASAILKLKRLLRKKNGMRRRVGGGRLNAT